MEKRIRSPNYPALGLPEAVEKVSTIYRAMHTHAGPREVIAKAMGYTGLNGASATAISALHKFGLLEKVGEEIKVSERAMRILAPHSPAERAQAIREAAREPALFAKIAERFPGRMPNEDLLKNYLIRESFAPAALAQVIAAYRDTSDMVERESDGRSPLSTEAEVQPSASQPLTITPTSVIALGPAIQPAQERSIGRYDFEGGAYVRIVASDDLDTAEALDMVETLIALKRKELERTNKRATVRQAEDTSAAENEDDDL